MVSQTHRDSVLLDRRVGGKSRYRGEHGTQCQEAAERDGRGEHTCSADTRLVQVHKASPGSLIYIHILSLQYIGGP